jgi:hypothetical protein
MAAAKRRAVARKSVPERQSRALPEIENVRIDGAPNAQDEDAASNYERELDRLDAAARAER